MKHVLVLTWAVMLMANFSSSTLAHQKNIDRECYKQYSNFVAYTEKAIDESKKEGGVAEDTAWGAANSAFNMYMSGCWPALQENPMDSEMELESEQSLPLVVGCASLAPHIVQMTAEQDSENSPRIMKIYNPENLSESGFQQLLSLIISKETQRLGGSSDAWALARRESRKRFSLPLKGSERLYNCVGTARLVKGPNMIVQFYKDRDSDGSEFIGLSYLTEK